MATGNDTAIKVSDLFSPDFPVKIDEIVKKLDEMNDAYMNMATNSQKEAKKIADSLGSVSGATENNRKKIRESVSDSERLNREWEKAEKAAGLYAQAIADAKMAQQQQNTITKLTVKLNRSAEGSYDRLSAQYSLNKINLNGMTDEMRKNTQEGRALEAQTRQIYEEMNRLQKATGKSSLNVGNYPDMTSQLETLNNTLGTYGDKIKSALGVNNEFADSLFNLVKNGEGTKGIFTQIGDGAQALGKTLLGLLKNPVFLAIAGLAGAASAFKWWYDYNAGLVEATKLTQQFTGKTGNDLKMFRTQVQSISDTFGKDFKEVLIATNALSKQFGIDANSALKLVQDGFIAGGDANGEFLDSLKEYPAYFKEAGISADAFVAIVAQTNKAGIFSDKGVDAIKEANIRLREMTKSTAAALQGIGISYTQVQKDLQSGAKTTFDVMQEVSVKLNELPATSAQVGTAIADIFGGPGEDAGLQYLKTLKDIDTNLDTVKGKAGELGRLQEEQLIAQTELSQTIAALFDQTGGSFESMQANAKLFVTKGITSMIKVVVDLINYFIDLYNESMTFRTLVIAIGSSFKLTFGTIKNLFNWFIREIKNIGLALEGIFTLDFGKLKDAYVASFKNVMKAVDDQVGLVIDTANEGVEQAKKKINSIIIPITTEQTDTGTVTTETGGQKKPAKIVDYTKEEKDKRKEIEAAYQKNLKAQRAYEDALLAQEQNSFRKRSKQAILNAQRQTQDLQHSLDTDKDLDKVSREAMLLQIQTIEQTKTEELRKIEMERQKFMLDLENKGIELRISAVKEGSKEELELRKQLLDNQKEMELLENSMQPENQRQDEGDINAKYKAQLNSLIDTQLSAALARFDIEQALAQSEFDLLKKTEKEKTDFQLKATRDRLQKILELNEMAGNKMSNEEIQTIKNQIGAVNNEIKANQKKGAKDFYEALGIKMSDETKEAISTSTSFALDQIYQLMDAKIQAAEAAVASADREVESAQNALDAELQSRANGYASNVLYAQKELDNAKANQEKALREQEKAQKQKEQLQSLEQMGNLITASSLIWSQLGFWGALPALATMWASFAYSKVKAKQLTSTAETYGDGGVELLSGGSHQSGNDVDLGHTKDGRKRRAEGGEMFAIFNKPASRKYRKEIPKLVHSFNRGDFESRYLNMFSGSGLSLNMAGETYNLTNIEKDLRKIRENSEKTSYTDRFGRRVEQNRNLKIIRNNG